jgi:hypothetical protein
VQYVLLRGRSLAPVTALAICLSLYLTPSAAVLVSTLLTLGAATLSRAADLVGSGAHPLATWALRGLDWAVPRMDLFDLGKKAAYGWPPVPLWVLGAMTVYAFIYTAVPFALAVLRFRRMPL